MGELLSYKQRKKLIKAHKSESKLRYGDRIKAILLLDAAWPVSKIAEALLIDEDTIRNYKSRFESGGLAGLCSDAYSGRECSLTDRELEELDSELRDNIYLSTKEVVNCVKKRFEIEYSISGMTYLLHRIGFSYKKPDLVPGKADAKEQEAFLETYNKLKDTKSAEDPVFYVDGVHPQHNSMPSYGWLPRGEKTKLKSNTGRQRVNISGALNAQTHEVIVQEHWTLNAEATIAFFMLIESLNPEAKNIYLILDNAGYHKGKKIQEYLRTSRIRLMFLPPYTPNLNLIERLWKFFKKTVLYNKYYATFREFKTACMEFFKKKNLARHKKELTSLLTENFQIVSA
jgi:transposase